MNFGPKSGFWCLKCGLGLFFKAEIPFRKGWVTFRPKLFRPLQFRGNTFEAQGLKGKNFSGADSDKI